MLKILQNPLLTKQMSVFAANMITKKYTNFLESKNASYFSSTHFSFGQRYQIWQRTMEKKTQEMDD